MSRVKDRYRRVVVLIIFGAMLLSVGGCGLGLGLSISKLNSAGGITVETGGSGAGQGSHALGSKPIIITGNNGESKDNNVDNVVDDPKSDEIDSSKAEDDNNKQNDESAAGSGKDEQSNGEVTTPKEDDKLVALTFDDGPDSKYTTAILDILKEKGVLASFFVVGLQVEKYPDITQRIVDEGHAIGNHTFNHKNLPKLSKSQIKNEILETDNAMSKVNGLKTPLFRAPYGAMSDTLREVLKEKGLKHVGWTVDTRDWAGTSIADMREMIRTETKPGGIILMHSFGGKHIKNTVEMLPDVIDDLRRMGYTFVTVDQLP